MATAPEISSDFKDKCINQRALFYKKPIKKDNYRLEIDDDDTPQEIRRQHLLREQKKNRDAAFNIGRGILEEAFNSQEENDEYMEVDKKHSYRRNKRYENQLMMSEWMHEVPQDFTEKWLMVPCPQGRRTLVVACKGKTNAYNKRGIRLGKFNSALPGGNSEERRNSCTILDCIWIKELKTYFVLDVLAWSNQPLLNCDTEFRFFWLKSQLEEMVQLKTGGSRINGFPILPLPNVSCDSNLYEFLTNVPLVPPLDGLLFYHREGLYTGGRTPLVTWLKPFMLPEIIGVSIPSPFDEKPDGYINFKHYIQNSTAKGKKQKSLDNHMEITDTGA